MKSTRKKPLGHPVILSRVTQYFAVTFHQTRSQQPFKTRKANIPATLCSVILTWLETKLISTTIITTQCFVRVTLFFRSGTAKVAPWKLFEMCAASAWYTTRHGGRSSTKHRAAEGGSLLILIGAKNDKDWTIERKRASSFRQHKLQYLITVVVFYKSC